LCFIIGVFLLSLLVLNAAATPDFSTLSLHDALPISGPCVAPVQLRLLPEELVVVVLTPGRLIGPGRPAEDAEPVVRRRAVGLSRSEEHTSELQSLAYLVCRLLLEKKNGGREEIAARI